MENQLEVELAPPLVVSPPLDNLIFYLGIPQFKMDVCELEDPLGWRTGWRGSWHLHWWFLHL